MIITESASSLNQPLQGIRSVISEDLTALDELIRKELVSSIPLIQDITQHIIKNKGKRLRPLLVLLSANALGYHQGTEHLELATIIEFVHTATLLHDDVVDSSALRRGEQTANAIWGNPASVLVGDFLYSRAFQLLTSRNRPQIMNVLASTTNAIAEGEVMQLMYRHNPELTEANYLEIIHRKTAKLFESSAEIGATLGTTNRNLQKAMADFGLNLGLAFQIIDDLLDYTASPHSSGKNIGDDLAEGKATLPLIFAMQKTNTENAALIRKALREGELKQLADILQILDETKTSTYCSNKANEYIQKALASLKIIPQTPYKQALIELAQFAIDRNY